MGDPGFWRVTRQGLFVAPVDGLPLLFGTGSAREGVFLGRWTAARDSGGSRRVEVAIGGFVVVDDGSVAL